MTRYVTVVAALGLAIALVLYARAGRGEEASLAGGNYRVLSAAQSAELVRFGKDVRACLIGRGLGVDPLVVRSTRISMRLASTKAATVARELTACGEQLGGPPPRSSLQVRGAEVLLYLPVRCLLDAKVVQSESS